MRVKYLPKMKVRLQHIKKKKAYCGQLYLNFFFLWPRLKFFFDVRFDHQINSHSKNKLNS